MMSGLVLNNEASAALERLIDAVRATGGIVGLSDYESKHPLIGRVLRSAVELEALCGKPGAIERRWEPLR